MKGLSLVSHRPIFQSPLSLSEAITSKHKTYAHQWIYVVHCIQTGSLNPALSSEIVHAVLCVALRSANGGLSVAEIADTLPQNVLML